MGECVRCGCETQYITAGGVCSACRHEEEMQKYNERERERQEIEERERRERERE